MFRLFSLFTLFFSLFAIPLVQATSADSDSISISKKHSNISAKTVCQSALDLERQTLTVSTLDTSLENVQRYSNLLHFGNNGLPNSKLFQSTNTYAGFKFNKWAFSDYLFENENTRYYRSRSPYTQLTLFIGANKEQVFKLIHTQNINKNWNASMEFIRIRSEGGYTRQTTNDNSFRIGTNYLTKNNRYGLLGNLIYNDFNFMENGGIKKDSAFEEGGSIDKKLIAINLINAQKRFRSREINVSQFLNFGNRIVLDSLNTVVNSKVAMVYDFEIKDYAYVYDDKNPAGGFYKNIFYDSLKTLDSSYILKIENRFGFTTKSIIGGRKTFLGFSAKGIHESNTIKASYYDTSFQNLGSVVSLFSHPDNKLAYDFTGKYIFSGYNQGDLAANGYVSVAIMDSTARLGLKGGYSFTRPDFIFLRYFSNHFKWINNFNKTTEMNAGIYFSWLKHNLFVEANTRSFANYCYFNSLAYANQSATKILLNSISLLKKFKISKLYLDLKVNYQATSSFSEIRVPEWFTQSSVYFMTKLFKGALLTSFGVDVTYFSAYYANAYNPATGQFYIQDRKQIGNYPFVDLFLNMKIKSARLVFKYEHFNSGMMGNKYYVAPSYPWQDGNFKFGIVWQAFD